MRRLDPLLMLADIAQVVSERPEIDEAIVRALYQHLAATRGRQPKIQRARDYIDRVTSRVDEDTLRRTLGLMAPRRRRSRVLAPPRRGRRKGSGQLTMEAVNATNAALRRELSRRPTQQQLAAKLDVAVRTLQDFLQANDLSWPLAD